MTTVGPWPTAAAIGDFNQDGKPDLAVVSRYANPVFVLLNQGDATFAVNELWTVQWPWGIVATDLNKDGRLDLAVVGSEQVFDTGYPPKGFSPFTSTQAAARSVRLPPMRPDWAPSASPRVISTATARTMS